MDHNSGIIKDISGSSNTSNVNPKCTSFSLLKSAFLKWVLCYWATSEISAKQELTIHHLIRSYFIHPTLLLYGKHHGAYRQKNFFQPPMASRLSPFLNWRHNSFLRALHYPVPNTILLQLNSTYRQGREVRSWASFGNYKQLSQRSTTDFNWEIHSRTAT